MSALSAFIGVCITSLSPGVGDDVDAVEDANARVMAVVVAARRRAMDRNMFDGIDFRVCVCEASSF
jgi:hypothetical protein